MSESPQGPTIDRQEFTDELNKIAAAEKGPLHMWALKLTRDNESDAKDLLQKTLLKAYQNIDKFQGSNLMMWLYTILYRSYLDFRRKKHPEVMDHSHLEHAMLRHQVRDRIALATPEDTLLSNEGKDHVGVVLQHLPYDLKVVLRLFYFEDLSHEEIATQLGIPKGTVMSRLYKGRALVAEYLHGFFPDEFAGKERVVRKYNRKPRAA